MCRVCVRVCVCANMWLCKSELLKFSCIKAIDSIKLKGCLVGCYLATLTNGNSNVAWQHTPSHTHTYIELCVMYSQRVIILFYLIWFDFPHISHAPHRFAWLGFLLLAFVVKSFVHFLPPICVFYCFGASLDADWIQIQAQIQIRQQIEINKCRPGAPRWEQRRKQKL